MIRIITARRVRALQAAVRRAHDTTEQALVLTARLTAECEDLHADLDRVRTEGQLNVWALERANYRLDGYRQERHGLEAEVARLRAVAEETSQATPPHSLDVPVALALDVLYRSISDVYASGDKETIARVCHLGELFLDAAQRAEHAAAGEV